uniref:TNFR-Cys domain-containing protein n=1 Tax=Salarias fasciatus TaxID=181472 RepID=A0A672GT72_SALFA
MMSFPNLSVANMPVYVLTFWIVGLASGCGDQQTKEDGICCNMCPPGKTNPKIKQTDCKPCEKGFFSDQYSNFDRCEKCRSCPKAYAENCTATTNAKCACSPGFLCSNSDCSDCEENKCVTGFEPKRKGEGDGDSTHLLLGLGCIFLSVAILLFLSYRGIKKLRKHRASKSEKKVFYCCHFGSVFTLSSNKLQFFQNQIMSIQTLQKAVLPSAHLRIQFISAHSALFISLWSPKGQKIRKSSLYLT